MALPPTLQLLLLLLLLPLLLLLLLLLRCELAKLLLADFRYGQQKKVVGYYLYNERIK